MGNSQTKESHDHPDYASTSRDYRSQRVNRGDLSILGLATSSRHREDGDTPFVHKETRAEREARKREKENALRLKERDRSLREEHVDGGYLVTLGVYVGPEDYSKTVVRQLQVERKLAPFWRGLNDWSSTWTEHQLIAAARGLPVPAADEAPDPDLIPVPRPRATSASDTHNLTVPMGPRTMSAASDRSASGTATPSGGNSRNMKPRAKAFAAALSMGGSRNNSSTDLAPREIKLPEDPFVNGQPLEVYLYKNADECPICFLTYPPYLNRTRCCDQPICSECFVQIKRADPHPPEHHPDGQARDPNESLNPDDPPEMLTSEPAACPYCQQTEFGVTYEPPPFRRGLCYSVSSLQPSSPAMSSQTSLNSSGPPTSVVPGGRRRTHSLSATAPNVITTDRVRPDWSTKLATVRAHQARRAAAATALHTAAFLHNDSRSILRPGRFSRRNTANVGGSSTPGNNDEPPDSNQEGEDQQDGQNGQGVRSERRNRMDELEDMMFMEAVRLSIAAEEERQRKEEKATRKEAKKREKEEKKAAKKAGRDPYSGGVSGASGSSLSLSFGRKRGNSGASTLRVEAMVQGASQAAPKEGETSPDQDKADDKGKGVDRGEDSGSASSTMPTPMPPRGSSHLRQMSNASSLGSSLADTPSGSYTGEGFLGKPQAGVSDDEDRENGSEPLFNYRSLAEIVGVDLDSGMVREEENGESPDPTPGRTLPQVREEKEGEAEAEHIEATSPKASPAGEEIVKPMEAVTVSQEQGTTPPEVMITPTTPAADADTDDKRLGHSTHVVEQPSEIHR